MALRRCVLILLLSVLVQIGSGQFIPTFPTKCERNYVMDITTGRNGSDKTLIHNDITYPVDKYFKRGSVIYGCICDIRLCISKCCTDNHPLNITCEPGLTHHVKIDVYHDDFTLAEANAAHVSAHWSNCSYFDLEPSDTFYIKKDGRLFFGDENKHYDLHEYCVAQDENQSAMAVRLCFDEMSVDSSDFVEHNKYGMLISIPFLLATLLVYLILPDKKLQTKCLMAYVTCLMLAYFFLIILQFNNNLEAPSCEIIAGCGVYFFMATFCWMNITCIDMYFIFSGIRAPLQRKSSHWKRFAFYVIFANGTPLVLLAIIFGINTMENFTGHPGFGNGQCWLGNGLPELLYFYGPMAILLTINTILFGLTTYKIRTTMKDNKKMLRSKESGRSNEVTKQDYVMYIKLFVIMGINWTMEFISWVVNWSLGANKVNWIWYPTDFCNAIYGILIFIIFVWKKTIWIKLQQRYYIFMGKPNMARALSTHASSGYQVSQTERTNVDESTTGNTYNQVKMEQM